MRIPSPLPFVLALTWIACSAPEGPEADEVPVVDAVPSTPPPTGRLCFLNVTRSAEAPSPGRSALPLVDSMIVELSIDSGRVSGRYDWVPAEKDVMRGVLNGTLHGDTITAVYRYSAEGVTAEEEKVLLLKNGQLWILNGELEERNGVWTIRDRSKATWTQALAAAPCK